MALTIPTTEPEIVRAGETLEWTQSYSDYPASTYTLIYYLSGPDDITITAAAYNTTDHLVSESSAVTAVWTYGIYEWNKYAEGTEDGVSVKRWIGSGYVTVKSSQGKSFAKTMLDAIEAILTGRATGKDLDVVSKSLGGAAIAKNPDALVKWRDKFLAEYMSEQASEKRAQGKDSGSRMLTRFTRPR